MNKEMAALPKMNIAVVGSGAAGLTCAWLLSQRHNVTLIEAGPTLGGHAHTVDVRVGNHTASVDTGFIVSNTWTYPNFSALMDYLDVPMVDTQMSFSVSADQGRYEYSGGSLGRLFGTKRQWLNPSHWRMLADLVQFYRKVEGSIKTAPADITLGQFLKREDYGENFIRRHILPMAGAIWSSTPEQVAAYPLKAFVDFFSNHRLFMLGNRPDWRTVQGGSRNYVEKIVMDARFEIELNTPVAKISRHSGAVELLRNNGRTSLFDQVVLATHGNQALALLDRPSAAEQELLSVFKTSANRVLLHRDPALMPKAKRFWSAWNYLSSSTGHETKLAVTYWMNALQKLSSPVNHFVSLNPPTEPDSKLLDGSYLYHHPIFTAETIAAQTQLWSLQGQQRTWFCGAWFGAGFHEDAMQAGLAVAEELGGVRRPWRVEGESSRIHVLPKRDDILPAFAEAAE